MYSRAGLSPSVAPVVAPSLTAVSTGRVARDCRADAQGEILDRSSVAAALTGICMPAIDMPADAARMTHRRTFLGKARFEAATAEIDGKAPSEPAVARPIEPNRKVE